MKNLLENITKNQLVELTTQQQHDILEYCKDNASYIGRGSSRATFEFKEFPDIVIKIIVDAKGEYQKNKEIEIYSMFGNEFLTTIYAYGDYFTICEKVEVLDSGEIEDSLISYQNADEEEDELGGEGFNGREVVQMADVVEALQSELGETSDNLQIGRSLTDGRIVSYDFGYESGSNRYSVSDQLSYVYGFFDKTNMLFSYLLNEVETDYGFIQDRFNVDFDEDEGEYDYDEEDEYDDDEEEEEPKTTSMPFRFFLKSMSGKMLSKSINSRKYLTESKKNAIIYYMNKKILF